MTLSRIIFAAFFTAATWLVAPAPATAQVPLPTPSAPEDAADDGDDEPEFVAPSQADEAAGGCRTPREAIMTLLYWGNEERLKWKRAAACFQRPEGMSDEALARRARELKTVLDVRGSFIDPDRLPASPEYRNAGKQPLYQLPQLPELEVRKVGDRWLVTAGTVTRATALLDDTVPPLVRRLVDALPEWFRSQKILGAHPWQFLGLVLLVFIALTVQRIVVFILRTYLRRLTASIKFDWLDQAVSRIDRPVGGLSMAFVFYVMVPWLQFSVAASQAMRIATQALAAYSAVWLAYRLIDVLSDWLKAKAEGTDTKLDDQLVPLLRKTLKVLTTVIGGLFILQNLDVDVGSLLAGLGLGGLAFALAAKDTVANFFGSVVIFVDKPFQIGDWVVINSVEGIVEEVGFRTTKVRTFYNSQVTVPNSVMTNASIDNYGMRRFRRYSTTLGLTYDTPPEKMQAFCEGVRAVIKGMPGMRKDYYLVEFKGFGDSALEVMLYCFMDVPDWNTEMRVRSHLNLEIVRLAEELGVSFAFPTRTLHVDTLASHTDVPGLPPRSNEELTAGIAAFAAGGARARPTAIELSPGHDCSPVAIGKARGGNPDEDAG